MTLVRLALTRVLKGQHLKLIYNSRASLLKFPGKNSIQRTFLPKTENVFPKTLEWFLIMIYCPARLKEITSAVREAGVSRYHEGPN